MKFPELSYASPNDRRLKRWLIHTVEGLTGRYSDATMQYLIGGAAAAAVGLMLLLFGKR